VLLITLAFRSSDYITRFFGSQSTIFYLNPYTQASPEKLISLIILIALAMTSAWLKGKRTQLQAQEKYVCRSTEAGRTRRRHSKFWIGLYGENWLFAFD
jgi:hypothetical protein